MPECFRGLPALGRRSDGGSQLLITICEASSLLPFFFFFGAREVHFRNTTHPRGRNLISSVISSNQWSALPTLVSCHFWSDSMSKLTFRIFAHRTPWQKKLKRVNGLHLHGPYTDVLVALSSLSFTTASGLGAVFNGYRIRLNHRSESKAATRATTAAAAENSAVISVSFFSSTSRELRDW